MVEISELEKLWSWSPAFFDEIRAEHLHSWLKFFVTIHVLLAIYGLLLAIQLNIVRHSIIVILSFLAILVIFGLAVHQLLFKMEENEYHHDKDRMTMHLLVLMVPANLEYIFLAFLGEYPSTLLFPIGRAQQITMFVLLLFILALSGLHWIVAMSIYSLRWNLRQLLMAMVRMVPSKSEEVKEHDYNQFNSRILGILEDAGFPDGDVFYDKWMTYKYLSRQKKQVLMLLEEEIESNRVIDEKTGKPLIRPIPLNILATKLQVNDDLDVLTGFIQTLLETQYFSKYHLRKFRILTVSSTDGDFSPYLVNMKLFKDVMLERLKEPRVINLEKMARHINTPLSVLLLTMKRLFESDEAFLNGIIYDNTVFSTEVVRSSIAHKLETDGIKLLEEDILSEIDDIKEKEDLSDEIRKHLQRWIDVQQWGPHKLVMIKEDVLSRRIHDLIGSRSSMLLKDLMTSLNLPMECHEDLLGMVDRVLDSASFLSVRLGDLVIVLSNDLFATITSKLRKEGIVLLDELLSDEFEIKEQVRMYLPRRTFKKIKINQQVDVRQWGPQGLVLVNDMVLSNRIRAIIDSHACVTFEDLRASLNVPEDCAEDLITLVDQLLSRRPSLGFRIGDAIIGFSQIVSPLESKGIILLDPLLPDNLAIVTKEEVARRIAAELQARQNIHFKIQEWGPRKLVLVNEDFIIRCLQDIIDKNAFTTIDELRISLSLELPEEYNQDLLAAVDRFLKEDPSLGFIAEDTIVSLTILLPQLISTLESDGIILLDTLFSDRFSIETKERVARRIAAELQARHHDLNVLQWGNGGLILIGEKVLSKQIRNIIETQTFLNVEELMTSLSLPMDCHEDLLKMVDRVLDAASFLSVRLGDLVIVLSNDLFATITSKLRKEGIVLLDELLSDEFEIKEQVRMYLPRRTFKEIKINQQIDVRQWGPQGLVLINKETFWKRIHDTISSCACMTFEDLRTSLNLPKDCAEDLLTALDQFLETSPSVGVRVEDVIIGLPQIMMMLETDGIAFLDSLLPENLVTTMKEEVARKVFEKLRVQARRISVQQWGPRGLVLVNEKVLPKRIRSIIKNQSFMKIDELRETLELPEDCTDELVEMVDQALKETKIMGIFTRFVGVRVGDVISSVPPEKLKKNLREQTSHWTKIQNRLKHEMTGKYDMRKTLEEILAIREKLLALEEAFTQLKDDDALHQIQALKTTIHQVLQNPNSIRKKDDKRSRFF